MFAKTLVKDTFLCTMYHEVTSLCLRPKMLYCLVKACKPSKVFTSVDCTLLTIQDVDLI